MQRECIWCFEVTGHLKQILRLCPTFDLCLAYQQRSTWKVNAEASQQVKTQDHRNLESTVHSVVGRHHARQVDRLHWTCWHTKFIHQYIKLLKAKYSFSISSSLGAGHWPATPCSTPPPPELTRCWPLSSNYGHCTPSKTSAVMGALQRPPNFFFKQPLRNYHPRPGQLHLLIVAGSARVAITTSIKCSFRNRPTPPWFLMVMASQNYKRGTWESSKGIQSSAKAQRLYRFQDRILSLFSQG